MVGLAAGGVGGAQHGEVSRDGALVGLEQRDEIVDAQFALGEQQHELDPGRLGEGLEGFDHRCEIGGVGRARDGVSVHDGLLKAI